jgi:RHS repeat-associated protein
VTGRVLTNVFPNGLLVERGYGNNLEDFELNRITHKIGATPISEFLYGRDHLADRITTWSQQVAATPLSLHTFGYDAADQLLSATVTNSGTLVNTFAYAYDPSGNRLTEQVGASNSLATYNALNQLSTTTAPGSTRTNEWDAKDRLVAVNKGNQRTEFTYDGESRMVSIRQFTNSVEASFRRFVWCDNDICEERDAGGAVRKRFFDQGMKVESGPATGSFFYTRDHLGSIRELTDSSGNTRARYAYNPYGRRTRLSGDADADFTFAGMFWSFEAGLGVTHFRAYDPQLGRWLSRDPLRNAEIQEGPNLYAYVRNNPVNAIDPLGLCCEKERDWLGVLALGYGKFQKLWDKQYDKCMAGLATGSTTQDDCDFIFFTGSQTIKSLEHQMKEAAEAYVKCLLKGCDKKPCAPAGPGGPGGPLPAPHPDIPPVYNPITRETTITIKARPGI